MARMCTCLTLRPVTVRPSTCASICPNRRIVIMSFPADVCLHGPFLAVHLPVLSMVRDRLSVEHPHRRGLTTATSPVSPSLHEHCSNNGSGRAQLRFPADTRMLGGDLAVPRAEHLELSVPGTDTLDGLVDGGAATG